MPVQFEPAIEELRPNCEAALKDQLNIPMLSKISKDCVNVSAV